VAIFLHQPRPSHRTFICHVTFYGWQEIQKRFPVDVVRKIVKHERQTHFTLHREPINMAQIMKLSKALVSWAKGFCPQRKLYHGIFHVAVLHVFLLCYTRPRPHGSHWNFAGADVLYHDRHHLRHMNTMFEDYRKSTI
jgi:hypothetical protein